jgi:amino acid transporter
MAPLNGLVDKEEGRMADETLSRDAQKLAELGYKEELARGWSRFSNFAISFTIISVLAGCFTTYPQAWNLGGPVAISWGWPIVCLIILTVAFSMAEVASAYPTAGGPYWWANELGGPVWSWFTGWFNLLGLIAIVATVDWFCAQFFTYVFNLWGLDFILNFADEVSLGEIFIVFVLILFLHAMINIFSSHLVALFNNISVFWHCVGVLVIIGVLIIVPDNHQSADFVFTERINNSGFGMGMYWYYILPTGLLLTMYTVTGYDASAHVAEETHDAEISAAKGVWQSVALSALIGWFVLLAITFAASDVGAVNDGGGTSLSIFESAMSQGWAEVVILISAIGQFFCGMACVTSCSRTFFALSRDRVTPGNRLWRSVNGKRGVPVAAVLGSCLLAGIISLPALSGNAAGVPVAFFAVVSIGVLGLYIAYVIPVYLRWRAGDRFRQGAWNLGNKWRWLNPIAVVWVILTSIYFCLPFYGPAAVWWDDQFDWNAANFTPLVMGVLVIAISIAWVGGMNKRYKGPIRTISFDEGMGITEDESTDTPEPPPSAPEPPAARA